MLLLLSFYFAQSALKYKRLEFGKDLLYGLETTGMQGYQLVFKDVPPKLILLSKQVFKLLPSFFGGPQTVKVKEEVYGNMST